MDQISRKLDAEFANETDEASGQVSIGGDLSSFSPFTLKLKEQYLSRIIALAMFFFQVNKGELLEKISDIRKEYAEVVKEAQAIQDTQRVTFFRKLATT